MRPFPILLLAPLALSGCKAGPDTPEQRIAHERHEHFEEIGKAFKAIGKQAAKNAPDMGIVRVNAARIEALARQVPGWFPKGSGPADGISTDALQTVWTRPAEFSRATARFIDEAGKFRALAQIGNAATIDQGAKALGGACKGCHDTFREKD